MRKLKNSRKILSLLLLGMFFMSLLILFNISNTTSPTQTQESLTRDNFIPEQKSPIQDDNPSKPSAPDSASRYNQTFSISQSEDDAFGDNNIFAPELPRTFHDTTNITLGVYDANDLTKIFLSNAIALRWDINVPKYATITKAYIILTVANLTFFGVPWTGFNTSIYAFNEASTNSYSNPNEALAFRDPIGNLPWELNGTVQINQALQTTNIKDLIQQIMELDDWDGIFGAYIMAGTGTKDNEAIQFWAYDYGNPEYYPKLFVEWENRPRFIDTPEDKYVIENNHGHSLKWQIWDDNPSKFKIICNESIPDFHDNDTWTSGWFTYYLPPLKRNFYNFTVYFNDTDGHLIWDSVIVEAGPQKPIISSGTYKIDRPEDDAYYKPQEGSAFIHAGGTLELGGPGSPIKAISDTRQRVTCLRFSTAVPKHVRIKKAYVNLTVQSVSGLPKYPYDGFKSEICLFYPPVADFSNDYDNDLFTLHFGGWSETRPSNKNPYNDELHPPLRPPLEWILPMSLSSGDTIQTPNLTDYLQEVIDFPSFNGYIGLYIMPIEDSANDEYVYTYSYDGAINADKPQFTPTLFVEWEESPYFLSIPADIIAKNGTRGYHLDWTVRDDNPTNFTISCNDMVSNIPPGSIIYSGVWQSGIESSYNWLFDNFHNYKVENITTKIRYDLPPLEIGVYNFTIRINDADSWYNLDSVIVNVTDLDLPVIDIKFVQNNKEVDYFQCGNGPFTLRIYNSSVITPGVWLTAYYPGYNQHIYADALYKWKSGFPVSVYITGDSLYPVGYDDSIHFPYNHILGCYEFTPPSRSLPDDHYYWELVKLNPMLLVDYVPIFKKINNIEYNLLNRFEIRVNGSAEYIYNQTIYGGRWARPLEVWNKDLTPPIYSEPDFIEPDEPNKHYEINIWIGTEAYGAKIDEVILYYSVNNGPWEETEMVLKDGKYYAEIPAQEEGATIDFYIKITDIAGNSIETDVYHEKAPAFEEPSIMIPVLGILLGIFGSLSIVAIYRYKRKAALKKVTSEKKIKKVKK